MIGKLKNIFSKKKSHHDHDAAFDDHFHSSLENQPAPDFTLEKQPLDISLEEVVVDDIIVENDFLTRFKDQFKHIFLQNFKIGGIIIVIILIISANIGFILKQIVNTEGLKTELETELSQMFGKKAVIDSEIDLEVLPEARLSIPRLYVTDDINLGSDKMIEISNVTIKPSLLNLFLGKIQFQGVNVNELLVNIKKPIGQPSNFLSTLKNIKSFDINKYSNKIGSINFSKININFAKGDDKGLYKRSYQLNDFNLDFTKDIKFYGTFNQSIDLKGTLTSAKQNNLNLEISQDKSNLTMAATLEYGDTLKLSGAVKGSVFGIEKHIAKKLSVSDNVMKLISENKYDVTSEIYINDNNIVLPNININNDFLDVNIKFGTIIADQIAYISDIEVTKFDLKKVFPNGLDYFFDQLEKADKKAAAANTDNKHQEKPAEVPKETVTTEVKKASVNKDYKISAKLNFKNLQFNKLVANLTSRFDIIANDINMQYFNLELPGQTIISLNSNLKYDEKLESFVGASGLTFLTKNSSKFFEAIDNAQEFTNKNIPELIALKADIYNYQNKIHFRKVDFAVGESKAVGQIMVDFLNGKIVGSSAFSFNKIVLEDLSDEKEFDATALLRKLDIIRYVDTAFDEFNFSVQADNLIFGEDIYKDFNSFIGVKDGKIFFNQLQVTSPNGADISGTADVELSIFQPKVNIDMNMSKLEVGPQDSKKTVFEGKWNLEDKINFEKYSLVTGTAKIFVNNANVYGLPLTNLKLDSILNGNSIKINKSRFEYEGSKFDFEGEMATEFPSLSLTFTATNLNANKLLSKLIDNNSLTGDFNISGNLAMNGANVEQWIKGLKGAINFTSTGARFKGVDLVKLSQTVGASSKIRDIRMWSDKYLSSGETVFGYLNGNIMIDKGVLAINDIKLANEAVENGKFYGKYDLVKWSAESILDLSIKTSTSIYVSSSFPVNITYKGNINSPIIERDIKGIEKYWENKFYSR